MKHLVITVHGIRTFGGWQERLERLLNEESGSQHLNVINYKFGYFSVLAFLVPVFRWLTVRRFRRFLLEIVASESWDRIDIIAHSFGTHIVAWALYDIAPKDRPRIDTLIFAGSVLKSNFPWQIIIGHGVRRVINDCGIKDDVLLVNQVTVLFTGMAGRLGFNGGISRTLRNRYFNFGHSDYFLTNKRPDDIFMRRHWVPLLISDADPELVDMRETSALTGIKLTLLNNAEPIKLAVYAAPFIAIALVFRSLYVTAERETLRATRQAALSDARADLIQSQLSLNDAPQKSLQGAYQAAQTLDSLGAGDGALVLLGSILNTAREVPLHTPYSHYSLGNVTVLARQSAPKGPTDGVTSGRPTKKPLMVVGSKDVTGVIDDEGRAVGRPLGSSQIDGSYTNDATWLDDENFVLATGAWKETNSQKFVLSNPALRLYHADGTLSQEYLSGHTAPVTSVAVLESEGKRVVLAGDAVGNVISMSVKGAVNVIPTGVTAPIRKILVSGWKEFSVFLVFGRSDPNQTPSLFKERQNLNIEEQKRKIGSALALPVQISYLGDKPTDDFGCAIIDDNTLYVCDGKTISIWIYPSDPNGLKSTPDHSFVAHNDAVTAIALSPTSPILATASRTGQIRLWLKSGTLLAEPSKSENELSRIDALGFIENGRRLISGSSHALRMWDLRDLTNQIKYRLSIPSENLIIDRLRQQNWVNFSDQISKNLDGSVSDRLMSLMNDTKLDYSLHGRFLIAPYATGLSLIDTQSAIARDVRLVTAEPPMGKDENRSLSDMTISHDASTTLCVLHGKSDFQSDSRRLYAVNGETGAILAEWSLPDGLKSSYISLATHEVGGEVACWAGGHQFVFIFSPKNGSPRGFKLLDSNSISHLVLRDGSNSFVLTAGTGSSSVVMLAHGEAGKDAQVAPGTSIPDSSVAGVVVAASANITGEENGIAINPDGSRIAVSIQGGWYNSGVSEVLLFNRHLDLLMRLPGSPDSFDEMQLSPDGTILRATASFMNYEQDLGLQSRLELARSRLQAWTQDDDRADFDAKDSAAHEENDWEKRKLILRKAVARYPSDPAILLRLANAEFATAKNIEDLNRAMRLYDQTNSVDPFDPMAHYARGKARAFLGDNRKAAEDFSAAIELPHILPLVQPVPGPLGINEGLSGLSYQLNLQRKADLYRRRMSARAATGDWQSVIEDVRWLREHKLMFPLSYELEAIALDNLNDAPGAIASYEQAAATLKDAKSYGLEEFDNNMAESAWRNFKFASYKKRVADIYQRTGHSQEATTAYAAAQKLIDNAFALPDLSAPTRRHLEQLSREVAKGN